MSNEELVSALQRGENWQDNIEQLYYQNIGMIRQICQRYSSISDHDFDDLMQQSFLGLNKAVDNWKSDQDISFITYATVVIKHELKRYIDETGSIVRRSSNENHIIGRYKQYIESYITEKGKKPSEQEIINELGITLKQLRTLLMNIRIFAVKRLDEPLSEDLEDTIGDTVTDPIDKYEKLEKHILSQELAEKLWDAVNKLKEEQRTVINDHYKEGKTLKDIASDNGWTKDLTIRLKDKALKELKKKHQRSLKPYLDIYGMGIKGTSLSNFNNSWTSATEYAALKLLGIDAASLSETQDNASKQADA